MPAKKIEARTRADMIFDAVNLALVYLVVFVCAYPIYYTVIASFSDPGAVLTGQVFLWPAGFTLDSYRSVLNYRQVWVGYGNTIFYTVLGTAYNLFLLLPASYALSRRDLKGRGAFMVYFVFTMYFGGGMVPYYLLMQTCHMDKTPRARE